MHREQGGRNTKTGGQTQDTQDGELQDKTGNNPWIRTVRTRPPVVIRENAALTHSFDFTFENWIWFKLNNNNNESFPFGLNVLTV